MIQLNQGTTFFTQFVTIITKLRNQINQYKCSRNIDIQKRMTGQQMVQPQQQHLNPYAMNNGMGFNANNFQ